MRWPTALLASLLLGGMASPARPDPGAGIPETYARIAHKHSLAPQTLYQAALQASGRASEHTPTPLPWPWTLKLCSQETCQTLHLADRATLFEVAQAALENDLTLYLGPAGYRYASNDTLPLWAATDPKVSLNAWAQAYAMSTRTASERNPQAWMTPIGPKPFRQHPRAQRFTPLINRVAREEGVNPALIHAVVSVESNYNPRARSHAGAEGLMQLMPKTAERFGLAASERLDPEKNLRAGIRYLKFLQRYFEGDLILMLAAYNAGEGAVEQYGRVIPPYPETQAYVKKVQRQLARFSATGAS